MPAPKGNEYGSTLKSISVKKKAFDSLCLHLEKGKSVKSWYFEDDEGHCTYESFVKYLKKEPEVFDFEKLNISKIKGFAYWEDFVEAHGRGENKGVTPALQMIMRNKYGWDKKEDHDSSGSTAQEIIDIASESD